MSILLMENLESGSTDAVCECVHVHMCVYAHTRTHIYVYVYAYIFLKSKVLLSQGVGYHQHS